MCKNWSLILALACNICFGFTDHSEPDEQNKQVSVAPLLKLAPKSKLNTIPVEQVDQKSQSSFFDVPAAPSSIGTTHVRQPIKIRGIPVFALERIFHYEDGKFTYQTGHTAHLEQVPTRPTITKQQALTLAKKLLPQAQKLTSELMIYPGDQSNYLTWMVDQQDEREQWKVFINAINGEVIDYYNQINYGTGSGVLGDEKEFPTFFENGQYLLMDEAKLVSIYDMNNKTFPIPGDMVTSDNDHWMDPAAVDAYVFSHQFLDFLKQKFNRDSFNGRGAKVRISVHFDQNLGQAMWNGSQVMFGDGDGKGATFMSGSFDIVAHEITHAITAYTSRLIYRGEPGALSEGFSDIMATYAEHEIQPEKFDWYLGEDVKTPKKTGDAFRYMNNPTRDPKSYDHYADRYIGNQDSGGVHRNSGIVNLAFYLLSEGGAHPRKGGVKMQGVGIHQAAEIFYQAFTTHLSPNSNFKDAKAACLQVAQKYGAQVVKSVEQAWSSVGVI